MLYVIDRSETNWGMITRDLSEIFWEDGSREPFGTQHVQLQMGKYKGRLLSDVADQSYLKWLRETAVDKGDGFTEHCVRLRELELRR